MDACYTAFPVSGKGPKNGTVAVTLGSLTPVTFNVDEFGNWAGTVNATALLDTTTPFNITASTTGFTSIVYEILAKDIVLPSPAVTITANTTGSSGSGTVSGVAAPAAAATATATAVLARVVTVTRTSTTGNNITIGTVSQTGNNWTANFSGGTNSATYVFTVTQQDGAGNETQASTTAVTI